MNSPAVLVFLVRLFGFEVGSRGAIFDALQRLRRSRFS